MFYIDMLYLFLFTLDRLLVLNPINIDTKSLRIFIYISERCPGIILHQFISEYCVSKSITIEDLLKQEKHQLYHKRIKNEPCCICRTVSTYNRVIPEKQWKALYEGNDGSYSHSCLSERKLCIERFTPKKITTLDLPDSRALILNIPDILTYMIGRLNIKKCSQFLLRNQHVIYHSMIGEMCCKCDKVPTEKIIINIEEWNKLFKREEHTSCKTGSKICCCQYSVRNGIKFKNIEDICLFKIFTIAGPIGVLNNIEQNALLYFLNWTADAKPLRKALTYLLNMIKDKMFSASISSFIPPESGETSSKELDSSRWIARHLRKQETTAEQQLQILIRDEDRLIVRSVLIPKDFSPPLRMQVSR
ncbi:uncharacterized protein LOC127703826 [Mytilus californianus]|uniref:uncharacterized protein LOC127703826 n=1 Tax=Mytilus californianus TaxID=6549 RepID=UPI002245DFC3|nr:uncharacterized protein LOC127703826 [Mytilus californianus]